MISAIQKQRLNRRMLPFIDSLIESERGLLVELNEQSYVVNECDLKTYVYCESYDLKLVEVNIFDEKIIKPAPFTLEYLLEHWNIVQNWFFVTKDNNFEYKRITVINDLGVYFAGGHYACYSELAVNYYAFNGVDYFNCIIETAYEIAEKTKNVTFKTK